MRCERARLRLSVALDETPSDDEAAALHADLAGCAVCAAEERRWRELRSQLRVEALGTVPDVTSRVLQALPACPPAPSRRQRQLKVRRLAPVLATFLAGAIVGAAVMAINRPAEVVAADLARACSRRSAPWRRLTPTCTSSNEAGIPRFPFAPSRGRCVTGRRSRLRYRSSTRRVTRPLRGATTTTIWSSPRGDGGRVGRAPVRCSSSRAARSTSRACGCSPARAVRGGEPGPARSRVAGSQFQCADRYDRAAHGHGGGAGSDRSADHRGSGDADSQRSAHGRQLARPYPGDEVEPWLDEEPPGSARAHRSTRRWGRAGTVAGRARLPRHARHRAPRASLARVEINDRLPPESFLAAPHDARSRGAGFVATTVDLVLGPSGVSPRGHARRIGRGRSHRLACGHGPTVGRG